MRCKSLYWASQHTEFTDTESSIGLWIIGAADTGFGIMSVSSKGIEYLLGPSSFTGINISLVDGDRLSVNVINSTVGNIPRYFAKISMFEHNL